MSRAVKCLLIGSANRYFRHEQLSRSDLQLWHGCSRPAETPELWLRVAHMLLLIIMFDIVVSPRAFAVLWNFLLLNLIERLQTGLRIIFNQQCAQNILKCHFFTCNFMSSILTSTDLLKSHSYAFHNLKTWQQKLSNCTSVDNMTTAELFCEVLLNPAVGQTFELLTWALKVVTSQLF